MSKFSEYVDMINDTIDSVVYEISEEYTENVHRQIRYFLEENTHILKDGDIISYEELKEMDNELTTIIYEYIEIMEDLENEYPNNDLYYEDIEEIPEDNNGLFEICIGENDEWQIVATEDNKALLVKYYEE